MQIKTIPNKIKKNLLINESTIIKIIGIKKIANKKKY